MFEKPELLDGVWKKRKVTCYNSKPRKNENNIDLSLIVPLYNLEVFVEKLVKSLSDQKTKYKYEVIFVDDGSTDKTFEFLEKYTQKYSKIMKISKRNNGGVSIARNAGLDMAKGRYIGFIDGDDFVSEKYVDRLLDLAYKNDADIVKCADADVKNGKIISKNCKPNKKMEDGMGKEILEYPSYVWAAIYKSELLENIKFPDGYWYEDMIVRFLLYRKARTFVNFEEVLYYRVSHDNQITKLMPSSGSAQCLEQLYLIEQLVDDNIRNGLENDIYLYLNVLLECSNIMVSRIGIMSEDVKKQVFARVYKLISGLYKEEYAKQLKGEWKLKSDIILKKRYDLWLMEKYL
ncbi:MAG: glycosyltransferase [Candidatus Saccharibacteria bacterium]|nr:glycosyltransferase [Candidatus Saccharibacteria bacterium]